MVQGPLPTSPHQSHYNQKVCALLELQTLTKAASEWHTYLVEVISNIICSCNKAHC
jgi:hypothetical protein